MTRRVEYFSDRDGRLHTGTVTREWFTDEPEKTTEERARATVHDDAGYTCHIERDRLRDPFKDCEADEK